MTCTRCAIHQDRLLTSRVYPSAIRVMASDGKTSCSAVRPCSVSSPGIRCRCTAAVQLTYVRTDVTMYTFCIACQCNTMGTRNQTLRTTLCIHPLTQNMWQILIHMCKGTQACNGCQCITVNAVTSCLSASCTLRIMLLTLRRSQQADTSAMCRFSSRV